MCERVREHVCVNKCVQMCVCVCEREKARERERDGRKNFSNLQFLYFRPFQRGRKISFSCRWLEKKVSGNIS